MTLMNQGGKYIHAIYDKLECILIMQTSPDGRIIEEPEGGTALGSREQLIECL